MSETGVADAKWEVVDGATLKLREEIEGENSARDVGFCKGVGSSGGKKSGGEQE